MDSADGQWVWLVHWEAKLSRRAGALGMGYMPEARPRSSTAPEGQEEPEKASEGLPSGLRDRLEAGKEAAGGQGGRLALRVAVGEKGMERGPQAGEAWAPQPQAPAQLQAITAVGLGARVSLLWSGPRTPCSLPGWVRLK